MTLRPGSLRFLIIAITTFGTPGFLCAQPAAKQVYVYIDSVMAADTNEGTDPRLGGMDKKLRGLFGVVALGRRAVDVAMGAIREDDTRPITPTISVKIYRHK